MIKVLDKKTADKIAAGEVVERPLSIIKELIENSLDAGADNLVIEIKNGGKSYIRVTDNGSGIAPEECEKAFLRHATSKIEKVEDLDSIYTLGFRGEALASIAAVSKVELITKTKDNKVGRRVEIHGGDVLENASNGCPDGTTFIVRDLFYNTPARLKFLKKDSTEASAVIDFVTHMALAYPKVRFRMISNDKILFATNGKGDRLNTIMTLTSKILTDQLIPFDFEYQGVSIEGYVSGPGESRKNRKNQVFFVNGRNVDSKIIEKGINLAYMDRLFDGRFPICYLFINVSADTMDVNIHPNKKEVRFFNEQLITDSVKDGIIRALNSKLHVPNIRKAEEVKVPEALRQEQMTGLGRAPVGGPLRSDSSGTVKSGGLGEQVQSVGSSCSEASSPASAGMIGSAGSSLGSNGALGRTDMASGGTAPAGGLSFGEARKSEIAGRESGMQVAESKGPEYDFRSKTQENIKEFVEKEGTKKSFEDINNILKSFEAEEQEQMAMAKEQVPTEELKHESEKRFDFTSLEVHGQFFRTYIELTDKDTIYFVDQHAAHERVFFEKLMNEFESREKHKQQILIPILLDVTMGDMEKKDQWLEPLSNMGFTLEEFGPSTFKVVEIPMFFDMEESEDFLKEFVGSLDDIKDFTHHGTWDKIATRACKSAVKGHDILSDDEIHALLEDLSNCKNPFSCPHGRPVFIQITEKELEKRFKRIQ